MARYKLGSTGHKARKVKTRMKWGKLTDESIVSIAEKMARGCTQEQACMSENPEPINPETHSKALQQVPEWKLIHQRAMALFMVDATDAIWKGDLGPSRRVNGILALLERRYQHQWSKPAQVAIHNETTTNVLVAGIDAKSQSELQQRLANLCKSPALPAPTIDAETVPAEQTAKD